MLSCLNVLGPKVSTLNLRVWIKVWKGFGGTTRDPYVDAHCTTLEKPSAQFP